MAFSSNICDSCLSSKAPNKSKELCTTKVPAVVPYVSNAYRKSTISHSMPSEDCMVGSYHEKLKEIIREALCNPENPEDSMILIDALQHFVIDYHFQEEIKIVLSRQYRSFGGGEIGHDLYNVSLYFRLLRQEGYHVPADVFNKFKNKDGEFKVSLIKDIRGMMGLYEASQLGIEGEHVLEEANVFTSRHLHASLTTLEQDLARHVEYTLEHPYQKRLPRFMTKQYIKIFERSGTNRIDGVLQELAKLDFEIVQSLHQKELLQVLGWWRDLGLEQELKFARNQPLKWYIWSMATLTHPKHSQQRMELTKPISFVYIMDDIFDVYGTLDELVIFAEAINKWDLNAMEQLPHKAKVFCKALYDVTDDISSKVLRQHGWNPSDSLQKAWKSLCNAFLVEAKWFASGHIPEAEEYLKNGIISSGVHVVFAHIFFLLGEGINKETVQLLDEIPTQVSIVATILRLWDDLGSAKDENQQGHDGSYIKCYIKENRGSTVETARQHVMEMISNAWRRLNEECISPNNPFLESFTNAALNAARMVRFMYSYDDNQKLPTLKKLIQSTLLESIPLEN